MQPLSVKNLTYTYPSAPSPAVRDVSFEIAAGEVFGFLGPSGAGKSTTQNILIGLLKEFSGEVSILGQDLASADHSMYEQIGIAFAPVRGNTMQGDGGVA